MLATDAWWQPPAHLLQLLTGSHLLSEQRRLDTMEQPEGCNLAVAATIKGSPVQGRPIPGS
jgi:hypothetical protein